MSGTVADIASLRNRRIVIGVSGGIAAYKAPLVVRRLVAAGADVDVVLTRGGARFVGPATFEGLTGRAVRSEVWDAIEDETHVALGRRADVVAIYPATAHTMARAANGFADDLLTTTLLATTAPVVMAPAMHTEMWDHAATRANAAVLRERGVTLVGPVEGALMGGDVGPGRAVEPEVFVAAVVGALDDDRDPDDDPAVAGVPELEVVADPTEHPAGGADRESTGPDEVRSSSGAWSGRHVVVTAGGTREPIDPVRWLGNRSTGRMGVAIAGAAASRGAEVDLVIAGSDLPTPPGVNRVDVTTATEMHDAVLARADVDVVVKAAAVADFRPSDVADRKLKKADGAPTVSLVPNPDILADLGRRRADGAGRPTVLVGFAAETDDVVANGRDKLARKQADLLVVNDVSADGAGFAHDTNEVVILTADGGRIDVPLTSKDAVAERLLDVVDARLAAVEKAPSEP